MDNEIRNFIMKTIGSAESCLMIARDEQELGKIEQEAIDSGFRKSGNISDLFGSIKEGVPAYLILGDVLGNNIYNILAQYPTGQVTAFDGKNSLTADPDHNNSSVLIIITKENLKKIEQGDKSLMRIVGLTWQK